MQLPSSILVSRPRASYPPPRPHLVRHLGPGDDDEGAPGEDWQLAVAPARREHTRKGSTKGVDDDYHTWTCSALRAKLHELGEKTISSRRHPVRTSP